MSPSFSVLLQLLQLEQVSLLSLQIDLTVSYQISFWIPKIGPSSRLQLRRQICSAYPLLDEGFDLFSAFFLLEAQELVDGRVALLCVASQLIHCDQSNVFCICYCGGSFLNTLLACVVAFESHHAAF